MTTKTMTREEVEREIADALESVALSWDELSTRKEDAVLTPEEWEVWDRVDNLRYLLG